MMFSDLEPEYLTYLATQQGCSPQTLRTYRSAFVSCRRASAAAGVAAPDTAVIDRSWANRVVQEMAKTLRPRTVHRNITAWRSMLAYAIQEGYTETNPLHGVRLPKKDAVRRQAITSDDLNALINASDCLINRTRACMARALLLTAATGATRYSDLMPLLVSDLDLQAATVTIRHGKGDKRRTIPLPKQTVEALRHWLAQRRLWLDTWPDQRPDSEERDPRTEPQSLWLADRGRPLGEDGLRKLLRELALIAGIDRPIKLHDIRHSAATRMARQGMPLVGIQAVLGHTNLTTTQTYIAGAGPHLSEWAHHMELPASEPDDSEHADAPSPVIPTRQRPLRRRRVPRSR